MKGNQGKKEFIDSLIPEPLSKFLKDNRYMSIGSAIYQATGKPTGGRDILSLVEVDKVFLKDIKRKKGAKSDDGYVSDIYRNYNYDTNLPIPYNLRDGFPFVYKGTVWNSYSYPAHDCKVISSELELEQKCPSTMQLFRHIYGDSLMLGLDYATVEFMLPTQKLPVQVLFSKENKTAKSTILNHRKWMYGDNGAIIGNSTFEDKFNGIIVGKNFIGMDEGKLKDEAALDKIKNLVTSPTVPHRPMRQEAVEVPNFGKWFIATNREKFARIDGEDSRFWMIQCYKLKVKYDPKFEEKLRSEISHWIGFLKYRWDNRFSKDVSGLLKMNTPRSLDRLWFLESMYTTEALIRVKLFNTTKDCKAMLEYIYKWFEEYNKKLAELGLEKVLHLECTSMELKDKFFAFNNRISSADIKRMLEDEMNLPMATAGGKIKNVYYKDLLNHVDFNEKPKGARNRRVFKIGLNLVSMMLDGEDAVDGSKQLETDL